MPIVSSITRPLVPADNGTRIRVDSEPTVPTAHPRYAIVTVRNGFDGDVGILGHLGDPPASPSSPWSGFTTGEQTPFDVDLLNNTIGVDNNYVNIGAGVGLAVEVLPIGIGAVRSQTAASSGFFESRFYFMMRAGDSFTGDQPWVVATSSFSYDGAYNFTVVIGPSATEGDVYQCTGSARADPQTWTITRLANAGARVSGGNIDTTPVQIEVGDTSQTWVEGAVIEVARMSTCASEVSFIPSLGATLNSVSGTSLLTPGSFGRVTKVNGALNTWDLHIHQAVPEPSTAGHVLASTGPGSVLSWVAPVPAPALRTSIVSFAAPTGMFTMRSTIASMQYYSAYDSFLSGYGSEWGGVFDQTQAPAGTTYLTALDASLPNGADGAFIGDTTAGGIEVAFEIVVNIAPPLGQQLYVGYWAPYGPPFNPAAAYGDSSTYFASSSASAFTLGYGGVGDNGGLPAWQAGDVIGVAYNPTTARIGFFRNGVYAGIAGGNGVFNGGGNILCGVHTPI